MNNHHFQKIDHQFSTAMFVEQPDRLKQWPIEIVDLPIKHGGSFHYVNVYQRVPSAFPT
jgi:hypothetical protein